MYLRCSSQSLLTAISGRDSCNGEGYIKECLPNTVSDVYSFSDVDTKTVSQILGEFEFCVCRDVKAAKALLEDHGGDIDVLKAAELWIFQDAPAKRTGKTGLANAGAVTDAGGQLKRFREVAGLAEDE